MILLVVLTSPKSWLPAFLAKSAISQFEVIRTFGKLPDVVFSNPDYAPDKV